jgi:septum site-determining protein MinC
MNEVLSAKEILIDLSNTGSFENILFELTNIIEKSDLQGKDVKINFGDLSLTQNMISNLQSVLKGFEINTKMVFSSSIETKIAAMEVGLTVSGEILEVKQQNIPSAPAPEEPKAEDKLVNAMNKVLSGSHEIVKEETLYIKQTLRSGQKIEHEGNIVIIGDCKAGSEITASGDITIWGILGGIAHAGSKGDYNATIRAFRINAIQLRIADLLARKPDAIEMEKIDKHNQFTPEEAKITNGEIVIYTEY